MTPLITPESKLSSDSYLRRCADLKLRQIVVIVILVVVVVIVDAAVLPHHKSPI